MKLLNTETKTVDLGILELLTLKELMKQYVLTLKNKASRKKEALQAACTTVNRHEL